MNSQKYTCKQQTQMLTQNYEHMWKYINGYNVRIVPFTEKVIYVTNLDVGGCEETLCFPSKLMQPWKKNAFKNVMMVLDICFNFKLTMA